MFKLAIDSIVWAFKHTMRNIADTGLLILRDLWINIQNSEAAVSFYRTFLLSLLKDIFAVLTDTLHKSGLFFIFFLFIIIFLFTFYFFRFSFTCYNFNVDYSIC